MKTRTTRVFRLSEKFLEPYKTKDVPWGPVGYITYKRTYARRLDDANPDAGTEEWWQTCRRVIEGMFTMQKRHCVQAGLPWNNAKAQRTAQIAYDRLFDLKWTPPGRGLWMMGTDFVENRTGAGLFNCWQGDTRVLTRQGYMPIKDLAGTEPELMVDTGTWVKAPVRSFGRQKLLAIKLKHQHGHEKTMYATAGHRWFAREKYDSSIQEYTTSNLPVGAYLQLVFGQGNKTTMASPQGIQAGLVYGDGTVQNGRGRLVLCGERNKPLAEFFPLNRQLEYDYISDEGSIIIDGLPSFYKQAPPLTESRPYLYGWLQGYFAADGCVGKNGTCEISSTSLESLELFKSIAAICGIGTLPIRTQARISNLTEGESVLYKLSIIREKLTESFFLLDEHRKRFAANPHQPQRTKTWRVVSVKETQRTEEVFCATVEGYGHFVVEDHILSGNCAFRSTKDISTKGGYLFQWMMDALMVGIGVGFDTLGAGALVILEPGSRFPTPELLPDGANQIRKLDGEWTCIIDDSREGWVESVRILLNAFYQGYELPKFCYDEIRPAGEIIKGFGGIASGSGPLAELHEYLVGMYSEAVGQPISTANIVDTQNLIGRCVVAGNVRRSAALAMGQADDKHFMMLKDPTQIHEWEAEVNRLTELRNSWIRENIDAIEAGEVDEYAHGYHDQLVELQAKIQSHPLRHHRWGSNNSVDVSGVTDYTEYSDLTVRNGEPGYIWLQNARTRGRFKDPVRLDDVLVMGFNPCVEQQLEDAELCCLVETYPWLHENYEDYLITLKIAYLYAKTVTLAKTQWPETNAIMLKNRRIGLSMSGFIQACYQRSFVEMYEWCDNAYTYVQDLDKIYSDWLCVPRSKRTTSIKPSGTVSKLNGSWPGIHHPEAEFYIQRIRFSMDNDMLPALEAAGYPVEDCVYSPNTKVVSFPVKEKHFVRGKLEVSMMEQLEIAAQMQHYWADNSVSVTVTFQDHEVASIPYALQLYSKRLKAVSFLKYKETGYVQAPYEPVDEDTYWNMVSKVTPIQRVNSITQGVGERFCTNDSCEIDFSKMGDA